MGGWTWDNLMKIMLLPILALILLTSGPAGAQGVPPGTDVPRGDELPRTAQERALGLEGQPRGQPEQPAPDVDEDGSRGVDDEDDVVPGARPAGPRRF